MPPTTPSTSSDDESNTITWEHLEHAPPSPPSQSTNPTNDPTTITPATTTTHNNDNNQSSTDTHPERILDPETHPEEEAFYIEDVTGTGERTGPWIRVGVAPAIRIRPPGDVAVSGSLSSLGGGVGVRGQGDNRDNEDKRGEGVSVDSGSLSG
ncbi:hypothetical protein ASPBRDRAFT_587388 [Aspergillus brasiliensis CBS 101740]|uniref:Uncharacterized protein n=1 Tax=Aspergillus brasiliensis (strain CBS 101740 / IMI 381727 / IBT 21946) TaxID=767769 RepID=A0A1L9UKD9_ASPBC|nr:hypothetical protein ASPBRDRAFT_587388 [Aspergillus brasiliensis CBS 101740]